MWRIALMHAWRERSITPTMYVWRLRERSTTLLLAISLLSGCEHATVSSGDTTAAATSASSTSPIQSDVSHYTVAGDSLRLVQHDENLPAGFPLQVTPLTVRNPYEGDKRATATGGQLFVGYNCIDCHGADGSGAMGPSFQDGRWHFGGSPGEVFESIYQGRPDGMPAWGGRISDDQIWMLTAYVRSLSSKDVSTENFTGKTVERTGH
jgi:cytochrome c oxidase cbb3-type subunit 3